MRSKMLENVKMNVWLSFECLSLSEEEEKELLRKKKQDIKDLLPPRYEFCGFYKRRIGAMRYALISVPAKANIRKSLKALNIEYGMFRLDYSTMHYCDKQPVEIQEYKLD